MSGKKLKTIGVLGGMGPEAGAYLLERIIHETAAARDQDHPPVIVYSLPQVPDRTEAILHGGPSPVPALQRRAPHAREGGRGFRRHVMHLGPLFRPPDRPPLAAARFSA